MERAVLCRGRKGGKRKYSIKGIEYEMEPRKMEVKEEKDDRERDESS